MIIKKITTGFVVQTIDTDTNTVTQEFIGGDQVDYEYADGSTVPNNLIEDIDTKYYLPFNMVQD